MRGDCQHGLYKAGMGSSRVLSDFAEKYGSKNRVLAGFGIGGKSGKEKDQKLLALRPSRLCPASIGKMPCLSITKPCTEYTRLGVYVSCAEFPYSASSSLSDQEATRFSPMDLSGYLSSHDLILLHMPHLFGG
ncbi:hypothetical protein Tco_0065599 [Tanacetum coccineum]